MAVTYVSLASNGQESVVYEFKRIPLLVSDRPRMTLIRRICTDTAPLTSDMPVTSH